MNYHLKTAIIDSVIFIIIVATFLILISIRISVCRNYEKRCIKVCNSGDKVYIPDGFSMPNECRCVKEYSR